MSSDPAASSFLSADNPLMPRLYQAAVGPLRADYYQQQFERFDTLGKPLPSWNWAAGCCTLGWMALRGLWRHAAIYGAALLGVILLWWALGLHELLPRPIALALALLLGFVAVLLPGLWGNAIYHRIVRERTMQALTQSSTLAEAMEQLQAQAPNPTRLQWATTGQIVSGLLLVALLWSLGSTPAPRPSAQPASGLTQQDTARALAALMPAAPATAAEETLGTRTGEAAPPSTSQSEVIESIALDIPEMPALTVVPVAAQPAASTATEAETATPVIAALPAVAIAAGPTTPSAPAEESPEPTAPSAKVEDKPKKSKPVSTAARKTTDTEKASTSRSTTKAEKTVGKRAVTTNKTMLQSGKYYLNSGIYAQADNAKRVESQLRKAGQPVFTQTLESSKGPVTRVRVGPFNSRAQAEAAARKIHALKLEAQLFRHAPSS